MPRLRSVSWFVVPGLQPLTIGIKTVRSPPTQTAWRSKEGGVERFTMHGVTYVKGRCGGLELGFMSRKGGGLLEKA